MSATDFDPTKLAAMSDAEAEAYIASVEKARQAAPKYDRDWLKTASPAEVLKALKGGKLNDLIKNSSR